MLNNFQAWQQYSLAALLAGTPDDQQHVLVGVVLVPLFDAGLGNRLPNLVTGM